MTKTDRASHSTGDMKAFCIQKQHRQADMIVASSPAGSPP